MITITVAYALIGLLLIGLLLIGLAIPLILGKVRPNHWYGFRIRLTLDNPEIWYPVNAWAGRWMCVAGAVIVLVALAALLIPESLFPWYALVLAVALLVGVVLIFAFGLRYARLLARSQK